MFEYDYFFKKTLIYMNELTKILMGKNYFSIKINLKENNSQISR